MPNNKKSFRDDNNKIIDRSTTIANPKNDLAVKSDDIQILDDRIAKYFKLQNEIRKVMSDDLTDKDALIDDAVNAIFKLTNGSSTTLINIVTFGIVPIMNHRKRKKLRKVIETILKKIFDLYLDWYAMDDYDVKMICDFIGGKGYFTTDDRRAIYIAVIQKLEVGVLRDKCIELGIGEFVQEKVIEIRNNFLQFKDKEL